MITLYMISSVLTALILTCDIFVLVHPKLSAKKYLIFFFLFSLLFFIGMYFDHSTLLLILLTLNSILLVAFTKELYSFLCIPLGYMLTCIIVNFIGFSFSKLSGLSFEELNTNPFFLILLAICTIPVSCAILYPIRLLSEKHLIPALKQTNKKLFSLIALTTLIGAFLIFAIASFYDDLEFSSKDSFFLICSLFLFLLFTISMILIVLFTTKRNYETQKKVEYLESLNEYTKNLELVYNNLRSFKHDYVNIMTSLTAYIEEKRYDELETFFYEHILPSQKNLTQKNDTLNNLLHVKVLELKSILYSKLLIAVNQNIEVNIDIPDDIDSVPMDPVDLTRMLGIYLDNAIEASLETEHPVINFHMGKMGQNIVFIISNTFIDKGLSVSQMQKKNVTTKGDGHGIGLFNVSEILNRYDNIYHETLIENNLFIQQIQIG